jgi:hypothetical protein
MKPLLTRPRPSLNRLATLGRLLVVAATAAVVFPMVSRLALSDDRSFRRLTVENRSPFIVNVEVTDADRNGWLDVGSFRRERARTVEELADQGRQWVFRFSYGGVDGGELVVGRERLAKDGWRITVPPEVSGRLRVAGLAESAP